MRSSERYIEEQGRIHEQEERELHEGRHRGGKPVEPIGPCPMCGRPGEYVCATYLTRPHVICRDCGWSPDKENPYATLDEAQATWRAISKAIQGAGPDEVRRLWIALEKISDGHSPITTARDAIRAFRGADDDERVLR